MNNFIAGVDEAGRGPLAGPVIAAAVILDPDIFIDSLKDSKKLSAKARETIAVQIQEKALSFAIGRADVKEIDQLNILQATLLAMQRAVAGLSVIPNQVLIDGPHSPSIPYPCQAIIKGDQLKASISAASIIAKVTRDAEMRQWHERFPMYGFNQHKGYGTAVHLEKLREFGPCELHRRSFKPVSILMPFQGNHDGD